MASSLAIPALAGRVQSNPARALVELETVIDRAARETEPVWTHLISAAYVREQWRRAAERRAGGAALPLFGVPFAVKDNIDVAGYPTTAGCPAFAYVPEKSATAVQRLFDAGAILIGKTNLDQFATGLVGTRSPYGACRNPFAARYIAGGSSSGSAVAVARGLVSFALGTDTAGSGRVPAAFCNLVGFKPSRGLVSTSGVVPACRSLDCVSVFALTCQDAARVHQVIAGYDAADAYSRCPLDVPRRSFDPTRFRFGVPAERDLRFFGNTAAAAKFREAVGRLESLGGERVEIDFAPFAGAARLLYDGPWVAERYAAVGTFIEKSPEEVLPVTRQIISRGRDISAVATFRAQYELEAIRAAARAQWDHVDLLLLPTTGTIYTLDEVMADPIGPNTNLGYYTNFVNLLDLCAVAVPNGFQPDGLPTGVTLMAPAGADDDLLVLGDALHHATSISLGATGEPLPQAEPMPRIKPDWVQVAVVGAHLSGEPLNSQLTRLGGRLVRTCKTSDAYRLYALPGTTPPKPGLLRAGSRAGVAQEVEVWSLSPEAFGLFVATIPAPLGIGTITLEDGSSVKSFLCESIACEGARDISSHGGWRNFLAQSR